MEIKQKNFGIKNRNISINIDKLTVDLDNGYEIKVTDFFEAYAVALEEYNEKIKEKVGSEVLVNKTNSLKNFDIAKIITSLLSIGIPLDATFDIAKNAAESLIDYCESNKGCSFDTKLIRKTLCDAIQSYDTHKHSTEEIQSWGQKYVRKYGRNNQVVKLQYDDGEIRDINFNVMTDFIDDVITTISPNILNVDISKNDRSGLIECVLDFVNSCDVYIIKYSVLKEMILEIALQPPHPWFINQSTKSNIMKYDFEQLKTNMAKMSHHFSKGNVVIPQSILIEVIHHASSLLLAEYDFFLGYNDLSSLYLLINSIDKLINRPYSELLYEEFPIKNLLSDITKADINYNEFLILLQEIKNQVNTKRISSAEFSKKVFEFGTHAKEIYEKQSIKQHEKFYITPWSEIAQSDILLNIKKFMNITFGYSSLYNRDTIDNNFFWHNVNNFASEVLNSKHNILVFYGKDSNADIKGLEFIGKGQTKTICNLIIVISETKETVSVIKNAIKNMFEEMKCSGDFVIIPLDKEDLKELYYSNNPSIIFENHIKNELLNYQ